MLNFHRSSFVKLFNFVNSFEQMLLERKEKLDFNLHTWSDSSFSQNKLSFVLYPRIQQKQETLKKLY